MEKYFWDTQLDYLKTTRSYFWNDDYFEFLVKQVWKFDKAIRIIDFGCGYGYLGMKLLELLPEGSTYTGIDMGEELLNNARKIFNNSPFEANFIHANLLDYVPVEEYDLAICQAFLRHIPNYKDVLKKMIDSVVTGGKVVCIEVNRQIENAGLYVHGVNANINKNDDFIKRKWKEELESGGRDYLTGARIPMFMEELGLEQVSVRINDFAEYISPKHDKENYCKHMSNFIREHGLNRSEVSEEAAALNVRSMIISYGTKY